MPAALKQRRSLHQNSMAAGMRAFFAIADKWRLSNDEAMILLGRPGRTRFYAWKKGEVGEINDLDLASRISYVLGIFKGLETLYQRPEMADAWVRQPNAAFGGQSALDRMLGGQMVDLASVRDYLDSVAASGW
ncbi:MAG: MbcA/ParS/Xre antitoxin family protein [Bacteroidota bacterium]